MDTLTAEQRSAHMALVRAKDSKPELFVRRMLHRLGYRFRLHRRDLPGTPDLVFPRRRKILFVHGCFWHRHRATGCKLARLPKTRSEFWLAKLNRNEERDRGQQEALRRAGWAVGVVWECELRDEEQVRNKLIAFLEGGNAGH